MSLFFLCARCFLTSSKRNGNIQAVRMQLGGKTGKERKRKKEISVVPLGQGCFASVVLPRYEGKESYLIGATKGGRNEQKITRKHRWGGLRVCKNAKIQKPKPLLPASFLMLPVLLVLQNRKDNTTKARGSSLQLSRSGQQL